ncbi:hypothetical protein [Thiobacillus sp.]
MDSKPHAEKIRLAALKALRRLDETLTVLHNGGEVQPGKLIALTRLTSDSRHRVEQSPAAWRDFVLRDAIERLRAGQSLAGSPALPVAEKCALLDEVRRYSTPEFSTQAAITALAPVRTYLHQRFPDRVRRHVHGTRWKVADPTCC